MASTKSLRVHSASGVPVEFLVCQQPNLENPFPHPLYPLLQSNSIFKLIFPALRVSVCVEMHISNCNRHNFGLAMGNHLEVPVTTSAQLWR